MVSQYPAEAKEAKMRSVPSQKVVASVAPAARCEVLIS
jgi:hypothetical protein